MKTKFKECSGCHLPKIIWKSHGKEKYCKGCWYTIQPPKRISPISDKMKKGLDEYTSKRILFLIANSFCKAKLQGCTGKSTEVHHKKGRGDNYLKISTWLPICRNCHTWVENNPEEAIELGLSESRLNI